MCNSKVSRSKLKTTDTAVPAIAPALLHWYETHGRHDLPWTASRSPYHVWVSEIMLQQTQVSTVLGYFPRFIAALPSLRDLADAPEDEVLALWTGLGYYSRARNLHKAAKLCVASHGGGIPDNFDALLALPGIGRSTAGAILAQAFHRPFAILDGNVKRVLARISGEREWPGLPAVEKKLWALAEEQLPAAGVADYTQALMDLGATVCTRRLPKCDLCPLRSACVAAAAGLTAQIPASRPKKTTPRRTCFLVWMQNENGAHYLEKRPASGIWGALWSLPQFETLDQAQRWLDERQCSKAEALPAIRHVFSHFKLDMTPLHVVAQRCAVQVREPDSSVWADADTLSALGIPAPVRTLLESKP